jgi:GNAT superfamily N-acetyltransferase
MARPYTLIQDMSNVTLWAKRDCRDHAPGAEKCAMTTVSFRVAVLADLAALRAVMDAAIGQLQQSFLSAEQIESSRAVMGLDRQLVIDGTYFIALVDQAIAGCGGWSRRATLYGPDHSAGLREPRLLDPATESARIRAMYTHPAFARRGVGRALLAHCEAAAQAEGFAACELMGTMAGVPLYLSAGYQVIEEIADDRGGAPVPMKRMRKEF